MTDIGLNVTARKLSFLFKAHSNREKYEGFTFHI